MSSSIESFSNAKRALLIRVLVAAAALACLIGVLATHAHARQSPRQLLKRGDRYWNEHSYSIAADAYRRAIALDPKLPERPEVELRILQALVKASKWDAAVSASDAFQRRYRKTVNEAYGLLWCSRLFSIIEHDGYRVGSKVFRGDNVPKSKNGDTATWENFSESDEAEVEKSFERCRQLLNGYFHSNAPAELRKKVAATLIENNFDEISRLKTVSNPPNFDPDKFDWSVDLHLQLNRQWPAQRRIMYLYAEIAATDRSTPNSNHHSTVLARLDEALYILQLRGEGKYVALGPKPKRDFYRSIPYAAYDPIALLTNTLHKFPNDTEAARLAFLIADWTEGKGNGPEAAKEYRALITAHPKSQWAHNAKVALNNLVRPSAKITVPQVTELGQKLKISLSTTNVGHVRFTAYRIHPEEVFARSAFSDSYLHHPSYSDALDRLLNRGAKSDYHKEKVASWTASTSDDGRHNLTSDTVPSPLTHPGAYVIEARAGIKNEIGTNSIAIITDIAIEQKIDRGSTLILVADSKTGKPMPNVRLSIWEPTRLKETDRDAILVTGYTDANGIFRSKLPDLVDDTAPFRVSHSTEILAVAQGNRYALTNVGRHVTADIQSGENAYRAYVTTDRPLYRPRQQVNYRIVVTLGMPSHYHLAAGLPMLVYIGGPRGELSSEHVTTGPTGTFNGTFTLPPGVNLGSCRLGAEYTFNKSGLLYLGESRFRVEEYKKPEFAVSVLPDKTQVRIGEKMSVAISAKYFFGAPTALAKVHYKVYRRPFDHPWPFKPRIVWYHDAESRSEETSSFDNTSMEEWYSDYETGSTYYREGNLVLDKNGEAKLSFIAEPLKRRDGRKSSRPEEFDLAYTVDVEVSDDSRRVVSGSGAAVAAAHRIHAAIRLGEKFVQPGDPLQIEIITQDSNDRPASAEGVVSVWKQAQTRAEAQQELVTKLPVITESAYDGLGSVTWRPSEPGDYILKFTADDGWGHQVIAKQKLLVYGPGFDRRLNTGDGRGELVAQRGLYSPGDTAHLLLVTPAPNSYALFAEHVAGRIVSFRVLEVAGRSTVIDVPITNDQLPNVGFSACIIRDGKILESETEINIASPDSVLKVAVSPDKPEYKPGERARMKIHATRADGTPASGEVTVGVVDEALLAMEPDQTPDIRSSFYGYQVYSSLGFANSTGFDQSDHSFRPYLGNDNSINMTAPDGLVWQPNRSGYDQPYYNSYEPFKSGSDQKRPAFRITDPLISQLKREAALPQQSVIDNEYLREKNAALHARFHIVSVMPEQGSQNYGGNRRSRGGGGFQGDAMEVQLSAGFANGGRSGGMGGRGAPGAMGMLPQNNPGPATPRWVFPKANMPMDVGGLAQARARTNFADTAYWMPAVTTDAEGNASVEFDFPDNITKWHITARAITGDVKVGMVEAQTITNKNLLIRLQAPRFIVDRDEVTLSANVHNYLQSAKYARVELAVDPAELAPTNNPASNNTLVREINVGKDSEQRVDWTMKVLRPGKASIKITAQTDQESDSEEISLPVLVHGVESFKANSGVLKDGGNADVAIDLPEIRRKGASRLDLQMSPSLAGMMLDALPYLEDFPYGCVEQTLDRFLPTVTVAKALRDSGLDLEAIGKRAKALEEQRKNIPPQQQNENSGYSYPSGVPGALDAAELASRMFMNRRSRAPVFDSKQLAAMTAGGLSSLYSQQRRDGSWGWWKGSSEADPYLTAYALEGLLRAKSAGISIRQRVLDNAAAYLENHLDQQGDLNLTAYFCCVLSNYEPAPKTSSRYKVLYQTIYPKRERLSPYGQALLALTLHAAKDDQRAAVVIRNLVTYAKIDADGGNVHWESADRDYWHWYNDKNETTAMILRALVAISPHAALAPRNGVSSAQTELAPMAVRWLVDNRRASHWESTRQTANVVYALLEYAKARKELSPDYAVTVDFDGKVQKSFKIDSTNALTLDNRFIVGDEILTSRAQKLHISMSGSGTLYWNSYLSYFDMSDRIKGTSNAISVERKYFKIVPNTEGAGHTKRPTRASVPDPDPVPVPTRIPLADGASLTSGDIIEVELYLKSNNDYEYVVFEDMKPAGCEAVETRSGGSYRDGLCSNFELRDEKVAFFIDKLPQGTRKITYQLRAEIPGSFHALPTNGYAMYAPDIRATSDEWRVSIKDVQ